MNLFERLQSGYVKGKPPKKGMMYCPYCENWAFWKKDEETGYPRAECCGISDSDFYVRKYNKTFGTDLK